MVNVSLKLAVFMSGQRQAEVAKRAGIGPTRFSQIVNGRQVARRHERASIANALALPEASLFPIAEATR
jgi:hypothetical protein